MRRKSILHRRDDVVSNSLRQLERERREKMITHNFATALKGVLRGEKWALPHWKQGTFIHLVDGALMIRKNPFNPTASAYNGAWYRVEEKSPSPADKDAILNARDHIAKGTNVLAAMADQNHYPGAKRETRETSRALLEQLFENQCDTIGGYQEEVEGLKKLIEERQRPILVGIDYSADYIQERIDAAGVAWKEEARQMTENRDFWRERAEVAERRIIDEAGAAKSAHQTVAYWKDRAKAVEAAAKTLTEALKNVD